MCGWLQDVEVSLKALNHRAYVNGSRQRAECLDLQSCITWIGDAEQITAVLTEHLVRLQH